MTDSRGCEHEGTKVETASNRLNGVADPEGATTTLLGFNALQDISLLGDLRKVLLMEGYVFIRTGLPLQAIQHPRNDRGLLLPWGCHHDYTLWPPKMCTSDMLNRWLRSRNVRYSPSVGHSDLVEAVQSLLREVPQRDVVPLDEVPDEANIVVGPMGVEWNLNGDSVFNQIRDLDITPDLDKDFIDKIFGHRCGVENRAMRLIAGGHFDLSTIKSCQIQCEFNGSMAPCTMFQIKSTPSMKANACAVNLVFKMGSINTDETSDRYMRSPYSHCDCPAGQMFCSHMLGFLGIVRIVQNKKLMSHDMAKVSFPESVKALSSTGILLEFVY